MKEHRKLTVNDREQVLRLSAERYTQQQIADATGFNQSTISRELRRDGMNQSTYSIAKAQVDRNIKASTTGRKLKLRKGTKLYNWIKSCLFEKHWSPEQICAILKRDSKSTRQIRSHETIYQYIYSIDTPKERAEWAQCLRRKRQKRRPRKPQNEKKGPISGRISIHARPTHIEERDEVGHWEGDTVVGKDHKSAIGTLVERKLRYTIIVPLLEGKTSEHVVQAFENELRAFPAHLRRSLTYDNGSEMALHGNLKKNLGIDVYFADPGCPGQRGTNENTNGLIREFYPKGTDFSQVTETQLKITQRLLNQRPKKILLYETPEKLMQSFWDEPPDKYNSLNGKESGGDLVPR